MPTIKIWSIQCPCGNIYYDLRSLSSHVKSKFCFDPVEAERKWIANRRKVLGYDPDKKMKLLQINVIG